jgi:UDP-2,4-diacetamido-2,4,6-trideoxy-beta-L-altropyranose hydrolase
MNSAPRTLILRTDASARAGTGHVMRCLALAEAWQAAGGKARLLLAHEPGPLSERLQVAGVAHEKVAAEAGSLADALATAQRARAAGALWVVVDGYHFGPDYVRALEAAGLRVLQIDDHAHQPAYPADIVLNHAAGVEPTAYERRGPWTEPLLGSRYALLRSEFVPWIRRTRPVPSEARRILVTLGGSDPDNATERVLAALEPVQGPLDVDVVVGPANAHAERLRAAAARSPHTTRVHERPAHLPQLMAEADLALAAGGGTAWELAALGVPTLLLVLADNQRGVAAALARAGAAVDLGWHADASPDRLAQAVQDLIPDAARRAQMSAAGRALVDGDGAQRVVDALRRASVRLRPATPDDARLLWTWANEAETRRQSFTPEAIPWETHVAWLRGRLADRSCRLYIAEDDEGAALGQFRVDVREGRGAVSVSLDTGRRGEGWGTSLIRWGSRQAFHDLDVPVLDAFVRPDNAASLRAFERAGYAEPMTTAVHGQRAVRLALRRPAGA